MPEERKMGHSLSEFLIEVFIFSSVATDGTPAPRREAKEASALHFSFYSMGTRDNVFHF